MARSAKSWPDAVRYGFGPLMHFLFSRQQLLLGLFGRPLGSIGPGMELVKTKAGKRVRITAAGKVLHLRVDQHRREPRVTMDEDMRAWATDQQRTSQELCQVHDTLRLALGFPAYDPAKEPWRVNA